MCIVQLGNEDPLKTDTSLMLDHVLVKALRPVLTTILTRTEVKTKAFVTCGGIFSEALVSFTWTRRGCCLCDGRYHYLWWECGFLHASQ